MSLPYVREIRGHADRDGNPLTEWIIALPEEIAGYSFRGYDPNILIRVVSKDEASMLASRKIQSGVNVGEPNYGPAGLDGAR